MMKEREVKRGFIMLALFTAGFVGLFSETALNIALSELSHIFQVSTTAIQWLATGYFLTLGILVPITGNLMQKFTTRQLFIASLTLSIIGTITAALAPVFSVLIIARVIQAAGLAIVLPLTQNVIFTIYPPNERGGAMGIMGLVILAGPTLGPTLAGLILDTLSWHWIFGVTLPVLLFSLVFGYIFIPNINEIRDTRIDSLSVILSTLGFGGLVYGFSSSGDYGWGSMPVIGTIGIGLVALFLFAWRQTKLETPMLNLHVFKHPQFVIGFTMNSITFFSMLSMLVILPMYMQMALIVSAFVTGLVLLPGSLLNCILAPPIGRLFDRYGPRAIITPGTLLVVVGYVLYSQFGTETALWMMVVTHIVMMLGVGLTIGAVQTNTLNALPKRLFPDGIAVTQTSQQVSGAVGIAIMISILTVKQGAALAEGATIMQATAEGTSMVFTFSLVLAVTNVVLSLFLKKTQ